MDVAWSRCGCWNATEATRVKFLVSCGLLSVIRPAAWVVALLGIACLVLRIVEAVRLKHDDLVVALVTWVLCVVRDPTLGHDLAWARRRVHIVICLVIIGVHLVARCLVLVLVVVRLLMLALRRLAFRDTAGYSTGTEIAPIWQVLEAHLGTRLGIVSIADLATSHIKC